MQFLEVFKDVKCTTSIKNFVRKRKAIYLIQIKFCIAISYNVQFVNAPLRSQMITKVPFTATAQVEQMPAGKIPNNRRSRFTVKSAWIPTMPYIYSSFEGASPPAALAPVGVVARKTIPCAVYSASTVSRCASRAHRRTVPILAGRS